MKKYSKAFTLAEVLITLTVIGVVAATTIPALMNKTQDSELKNAWKNDYAIINQAFQKAKMDNGGDMESELTQCGGSIADFFKPYFINIKYCGSSQNIVTPCFAQQILLLNGLTAKETGLSPYNFDSGGFILSNGATLTFENCNNHYNEIPFGYIWTDVNGLKAPNTIGKDIFGIIALKDRLIPMGAPVPGIPFHSNLYGIELDEKCTPGTTSGTACSAVYLQQ